MKLKTILSSYLIILIAVLTSALLAYRYFVEIPRFHHATSLLHQRELETLRQAIQREISHFNLLNFDYAVWDSNYQFMRSPNAAFLEENYEDISFATLRYDGIFYLDNQFNIIYEKTLDHISGQPFKLDIFNLQKWPQNKYIYPKKQYHGVPHLSGLLASKHGPIAFSSTQLRNSDLSGENIGIMLIVHKLRKQHFDNIAKFINLQVEAEILPYDYPATAIIDLAQDISEDSHSHRHQRILTDDHKRPVVLLTITHDSSTEMPLIDRQFFFVLILLVIFALSGFVIIRHYFVRHLENTIAYMKKMVLSNELSPIKNHFNIDEFDTATEQFNRLVELAKNQQQLLIELSQADSLTGIANRRAFEEHIQKQWQQMQRTRSPLALIMCDVDHFKQYNDLSGHQEGDLALRQIALVIDTCIHRNHDLVARYGGEEFIIVLSNTNRAGAEHVCKKILAAVKKLAIPHPMAAGKIVSVSIGAAIWEDFSQRPPWHLDYHYLLKQADQALYSAKSAGRDRVIFCRPLTVTSAALNQSRDNNKQKIT
ncbi:diguanylate cyclase domain-containing protein [Thalassomonas actiniarum]|uniref:diguanylate cyclase n=1 Tax=Thalassomonas actiniarum TaxID=485447 RepID=A0AAF0C2Z6_9GAMM|nr:diguanylate cyclase [Thalassomonas actiniarum]WDE00687.1 diguanylate cyclase [Thalassomonas actiniarum]